MQRLAIALFFATAAAAGQVFAQAAAPAPAPTEARIALVIGNGEYKGAPLANPVNDALDIAAALSGLGFQVAVEQNADVRAMKRAVREFGNRLKSSGGVGLFYFAGHGMQVKGRNYLIPVGEDIQAEDEVEDQSVSIDLVLDKMETAGNRVNIVVLDACRNNPFQRQFRSASRGLAPVDAAKGSFIAFATAPGSVAADGAGRNGVFTKHLLESLRHPGSAIETVFKRARVGVLEETGNRQIPWESSSLTGEFRFNVVESASPADAPAQVAAAPSTLALEIAHWQSVQGSRNPSELETYLERYPQGQFAAIARQRVAALRSPAPDRTVAPAVAKVHFFRASGFIGSALTYRINVGGQTVGTLGNGGSFSTEIAAGEHSISAEGNFGKTGSFRFEAGKTYYVELQVVPFNASLQMVDNARR